MWPAASAAAFADEWLDFLFYESLASVGGVANATMATVLTRTGRIFLFPFCIMYLLASVRVNFNPDPSARHLP
jgi:hypothetical protein